MAMKKHSLISLLAIILAISSDPTLAQPQSYHINGEQLLNFCKDTISMMNGSKDYNVSKSSWCIGFVQGAVTAHRFYSAYYTLKNPETRKMTDNEVDKKIAESQVYCVPTSVSLGQLVRDVVKYLETNPTAMQEQASLGIARALNQAYPCK